MTEQNVMVPAGVVVSTTSGASSVSAEDHPTVRAFEAGFLPADARVGQMRRITTAYLRRWDLTPLIDTATLVVSELVTNAVRHGRGHSVKLRVTYSAAVLRIEVTDGTREPARLTPADEWGEHGRGLLLVAALAQQWGVSPDGTMTWCSLAIPEGCRDGRRVM